MQRLNRSSHSPLGAAFFLFLGVAIIPISLRAAGVKVGFNPSLSAAIDAWQQIAEVFGTSYPPVNGSEMAALNKPPSEPSSAADEIACPRREVACVTEFEELSQDSRVSESAAPKTKYARVACPKAASRPSPTSKLAESSDTAASIEASFKERLRALESHGAIKLDTMFREELLKSIGKTVIQPGFARSHTMKTLPNPKNLRLFVQVQPPGAPSASTAACKLRFASASARRQERERTLQTSTPSTDPDNAEL